jgi:hypothetical protein
MLTPVALVDVLEHPLALAVRDIQVDIRRLGPFTGKKTFEKQIHAHRIDGRDTETETNR